MYRRHKHILSTAIVLLASSSSVCASVREATGLSLKGSGIVLIVAALVLLLAMLAGQSIRTAATKIPLLIARQRMRKLLSGRSDAILEDFILPGAYGGLTRIAFAVMTSNGIFCVHTVSKSGFVFGSANDAQWKVVDGVRESRFLNPLIQNEGRTRSLRQVVPDIPVSNLVVFTGSSQLSARPAENVIVASELAEYLDQYDFGAQKIENWDTVWMTIKSAAMTDDESRKDFSAQLSFS